MVKEPRYKYIASLSAKEVTYFDSGSTWTMVISRLICTITPQTGTSCSAWIVAICNTTKPPFLTAKWYTSIESAQRKETFFTTSDLKQFGLRRGYSKQLSNIYVQHSLDTPRKACLQSIPKQKNSAHTFGSYIPPFFTIPSLLSTKWHLSVLHFRTIMMGHFQHHHLSLFIIRKIWEISWYRHPRHQCHMKNPATDHARLLGVKHKNLRV